MLKSTVKRRLAAVVLGAVGILTVPGQAYGAVFIGAFDPAFGATIPHLGFRGQGIFSIPNGCLGMTGVVSNEACPGMTIESAYVDFYDTRSALKEALHRQSYVPPPFESLLEIILFEGKLLGVKTNPIGPRFVDVPDRYSDIDDSEYSSSTFYSDYSESLFAGNTWLRFSDQVPTDGSTVAGAYLLACSGTSCALGSTVTSAPAFIAEFTQVPEPGTVALALTALVVAGLARRRPSQVDSAGLSA